MGGDGSGRKPDVIKMAEAQRREFIETNAPDNTIILPNYSGLQAVRKTDPPIGTGGGHTIQNEGSDLTARSYLNFSGSAVNAYDDGTATVVSIDAAGAETDPIFLSLSGGLNYAAPLGADDNYVTDAEKVVIGNTTGTNSGDQTSIVGITGTIAQYNTSLSDGNFVTAETDPIFLSLSGGIAVGGDVTGTLSSIQIDHINIASIGTNTHAQIDTHIADTSDPHGATLIQTNLSGTNVWAGVLSGANTFVTNRLSGGAVWGTTISGSNIWGYGTISGSSIMTTEDHTTSGSAKIVGIITHTSATPPTASSYPQGTIYIQYTA